MARVGDAILFADEGNGTIRRFTPATGLVETLVRLPLPAGGVALPAFVAFDGGSTLYVTDRAAHVLYAVDVGTHALSIVAGKTNVRGDQDGSFDQATFDTPTGLTLGASHDLYLGDVGNRHIRRLDLQARTVSTLPAKFSQVWGLCFDGEGLYASDELTEALFHVDLPSGERSLVAGSNRFGYASFVDGPPAKARFHGPRGVACTPDAIFVAERSNALVRRWDRRSKQLKAIAGTANMLGWRDGAALHALFGDLQSVLVWDDNSLYLGDEGAIRKLDLGSRMVTTPAGRPNQGMIDLEHIEEVAFIHPDGLAWVPAEHAAFIAGCGTATVERVDLATGLTRTFAGDSVKRGFIDGYGAEARFSCVSAIGADHRGNLFVGDRFNHAVRSVHIATEEVSTVAGTPSRCGNDDGDLEHATFCDPTGIVATEGAVFVADASTNTIRRIDLAGRRVTTLAGAAFERGHDDGPGGRARFASPVALALLGDELYVADHDNSAIRRIDIRTGIVSTLDLRVDGPWALTASGDALLMADRRIVARVDLKGLSARALLAVGGGLRLGVDNARIHEPRGIANLGPGDLLLLDGLENTLVRLAY